MAVSRHLDGIISRLDGLDRDTFKAQAESLLNDLST